MQDRLDTPQSEGEAFRRVWQRVQGQPGPGDYLIPEGPGERPLPPAPPKPQPPQPPSGPPRPPAGPDMEGLLRLPAFYGFYLDVERTLGRRPELPQRRMEFIGNSITCGYGIEGDGTEKKFSYSQQNIYHTYEAITARAFNAQCQIVARSGIGIYRNNNGNPRGDRMVLPALYPYTQFGTSGERWDFSRYQPDVVCVNLGTNDTTNPRYDVRLLSDAYKRFVRTLRGHYPKAKIVLLTGTMISGQRLADVQRAQQSAVDDAATRGDHEIYRLDFDPADGTYGYGTHRHPSKRQHAHMAEQLIPFIKQITGW